MDEKSWQAEQFERHRGHLRAVAYRMLGSITEAEDAVQEAWIRLDRARDDRIDNVAGWLTTVVGRVCIDMLRTRQSRRESYVGTWLPEPVVSPEDHVDPEQESLLADSVGLALLVVLETLTPAERLAFVLHDMFGVPFEDIAPMVDRTPAATRQLASRARRRVRSEPTVPDQDIGKQREVVAAFLAATRAGDFDALVAVLDPRVVFRIDAGSQAAIPIVSGATAVAERAVAQGRQFAPCCRLALVNGAAGLVVQRPNGRRAVAAITVIDGRIAVVDLVLDPEKLKSVVLDD